MGKLEDDAKALAEYARGGGPMPYVPYEVDTFGGPSNHVALTANVIDLKPPQAATLQDEVLQALDELAAVVRSGEVTPLHLILSYADDMGEAIAYQWNGIGLSRYEMIGHLTSEATALALEVEG